MVVEAVVLTDEACAFPLDCISRADIHTFATADTFLITDFVYIHLTVFYTEVTVDTVMFFDFYAKE